MTNPRTHNAARRLGYALLPGDTFSFVLHLRPREWPIVSAHLAVGYVLAAGWPSAGWGDWLAPLAAATVLWVICLNGGTLALNSSFDRDVGDVGYLDAPPPPPSGLATFGVVLMMLGQALALWMPRGFAIAYAACLAMSLLYSVPPVRLKAVAGADWIINILGFGALTTYAGWAATGRPISTEMGWIVAAFLLLFAALYPLTQLYQLEEDAARGDRTLALVLGARASLGASCATAVLAFVCFAIAGGVRSLAWVRWLPLAAAGAVWLVLVGTWYARRETMRPSAHHRGMYLALGAWALTDAAVIWGFAPGS